MKQVKFDYVALLNFCLLIFVVTWTFLPLLCFPWMLGVLACELWNSFTRQFIYFVIVFLPDFCPSECLNRFLHCTLYQIKSFEAMWKWFSHLLPQVLLLQGNFTINVTVCRERSCVLEWCSWGECDFAVHRLLLPEKQLQHCRACCSLLLH